MSAPGPRSVGFSGRFDLRITWRQFGLGQCPAAGQTRRIVTYRKFNILGSRLSRQRLNLFQQCPHEGNAAFPV